MTAAKATYRKLSDTMAKYHIRSIYLLIILYVLSLIHIYHGRVVIVALPGALVGNNSGDVRLGHAVGPSGA